MTLDLRRDSLSTFSRTFILACRRLMDFMKGMSFNCWCGMNSLFTSPSQGTGQRAKPGRWQRSKADVVGMKQLKALAPDIETGLCCGLMEENTADGPETTKPCRTPITPGHIYKPSQGEDST